MSRAAKPVGRWGCSTASLCVIAVLLTASGAPWPAPVAAQTIRGLVVESTTFRGVAQGAVALVDENGVTAAVAVTDSIGLYSLSAPGAGTYWLLADALGYGRASVGPLELDRGDLRVVEITLDPTPIPLAGLDVETEPANTTRYLTMQGFDARRETGLGHFLGPMELKELEGFINRTQEIFYRIPGVSIGPRNNAIMRGRMGRNCTPTEFLDGVLIPRGRQTESFAPFRDLAAVEIYTRMAQVPLQYAAFAHECGVVLYWTKH